jgi:hypothetical protein
MSPQEIEAFVDAYCNNVASLPRELVADFVPRYEAGEDIDYIGEHTGVMDALGMWHDAIRWQLQQTKEEVHCLKCDNVWTEHVYLKVCPHCGNQDTEQTVYLTKEKEE